MASLISQSSHSWTSKSFNNVFIQILSYYTPVINSLRFFTIKFNFYFEFLFFLFWNFLNFVKFCIFKKIVLSPNLSAFIFYKLNKIRHIYDSSMQIVILLLRVIQMLSMHRQGHIIQILKPILIIRIILLWKHCFIIQSIEYHVNEIKQDSRLYH